ncbi:MAG: hypothetical protein J7L79_03390 [Thaumarchaeota archaeon]|nr:hypothetical protein [Nitrososphaerota archaeon]
MEVRLTFTLPALRSRGAKDFHQVLVLFLYALSTVSPNSRSVIKMAGDSSLSLGEFSRIFKRISTVVERWNYNLHEAVKHASKHVKDKLVKDFLERLSDSLTLDVNLREFMKIEFERMLASLTEEFDRGLEKAKKLIDGYSAILTSTTFLSVSMLLLSVIYGMSVERLLLLTAIGISAVLGAMIYLISSSLPADPILFESIRAPQTRFS